MQLLACSVWLFSSCNSIDLYEKVVPIPAHAWQSKLKPQFTFQIKDTTVPYQFYVILRHSNQYKYNNIWVNLLAQSPADTVQKLSLELPLANKDGWLGTGMDDIFEHRIRIGPEAAKFSFLTPAADGFLFTHAGQYSFTLEQIMRDDPLTDVMDVGFRLEKKLQ
ncbi:MAG TPA: gliding motility lipoprotein GldH [Flavisolibacter sp.]|nr:gliding motility lipoprotein GldH [Flavisolibacter sp.]